MQQVFAQAKALLDHNYKYWLDVEDIKTLNDLNSAFELQDRITELANKVEEGPDEMTANEILEAMQVKEPKWSDLTRFGAILNKRGFKKRRRRIEGSKQMRFYCVQDPSKAKRFNLNTDLASKVIQIKKDDGGEPT